MSWANKFSKPYRIESGKGFRLKDFNPDDTAHLHSKEHAEELLEQSIREMAGSAFITLPSSDADFANPDIAADIERYMRSGAADAKSRIKLMRSSRSTATRCRSIGTSSALK